MILKGTARVAEDVLAIVLGTINGPINFGVLALVLSTDKTTFSIEGPPEPITIPVLKLLTSLSSNPESLIASFIAMKEAIKDSGLEDKDVSNFKTGIVMGSGGPSIENVVLSVDKTRAKTPKLMGPFIVPRTMASTSSATLAVPFKIKGVNYTMSSACAHAELIV